MGEAGLVLLEDAIRSIEPPEAGYPKQVVAVFRAFGLRPVRDLMETGGQIEWEVLFHSRAYSPETVSWLADWVVWVLCRAGYRPMADIVAACGAVVELSTRAGWVREWGLMMGREPRSAYIYACASGVFTSEELHQVLRGLHRLDPAFLDGIVYATAQASTRGQRYDNL